jgi:hypothetical protein
LAQNLQVLHVRTISAEQCIEDVNAADDWGTAHVNPAVELCTFHSVGHGMCIVSMHLLFLTIWRSGRNTRLLREMSRDRSLHSRDICVHGYVCLYWVKVFPMYM